MEYTAPTVFQWTGARRTGVIKFASAATPGHGVTDRCASTAVVETGMAAATAATAEISGGILAALNGAPAFILNESSSYSSILS